MEDLEAALRARWDRETLRVFADALQAAGDPRGELIALDLEREETGYTHELATRRCACLYEWLGSSSILRRPWHEASFEYGFARDFLVAFDGKYDGARGAVRVAGRALRPGLTIDARDPDSLRDALAVPTEEYGETVSLVTLIARLEAQFDRLPPNARAAWRDFWELVDGLCWRDGHAITRPFPVATLLMAVEPLDDVAPINGEAGYWAQLAETLRSADLPGDAAVSISRVWRA